MLISEILIRKEYAEDRLSELQSCLDSSGLDVKNKVEVSSTMFLLFGEIQSYNILLNNENSKNTIKIKDTEVYISDALNVLKTLDNKIKVLTDVLSCGIINIPVVEQRDKFFEEYITLLSAIRVKDWTTNVK